MDLRGGGKMYIALKWMDARKLGKTGNLHVTNAVARILPNHDLGEAFDTLVVDDLPQADPNH